MTKIENREQYEWALGRIEALVNQVTEEMPDNDPRKIEYCLLSSLVSGKCNPTFDLAQNICRKLDISPSVVLGI